MREQEPPAHHLPLHFRANGQPATDFEIPQGLDPRLDALNLRFLAIGGASLAYLAADGTVLKINHQYPAETIATAYKRRLDIRTAEKTLLDAQRWRREARILQRYTVYQNCFGERIIPEERQYKLFPFPGTLLRAIVRDLEIRQEINPATVYELGTPVRTQQFVDLEQPGTLNLSTRYAEHRTSLNPAEYGIVTAQLMEGCQSIGEKDFDVARFLGVQQSPRLNAFMSVLRRDARLRDATTCFLMGNKALMARLEEPVDFIGINNTFFRRTSDGREWEYFFIDGLYEENNKPWELANEALWKLAHLAVPRAPSPEELQGLLPMLNIVRVHNALAIVCGYPTLQLKPLGGMWCRPAFWEKVLSLVRARYPARAASFSSAAPDVSRHSGDPEDFSQNKVAGACSGPRTKEL